ncbi:hypothetical protein E5288_WYG016742 [Bos mutus]|uniref:Uncharacterized protein n=1 Tax=Bos mutus TaxID=72004 RepID=A0A6B0R3G8_9CETA|nr:hypothetical protein [Bos mutus]
MVNRVEPKMVTYLRKKCPEKLKQYHYIFNHDKFSQDILNTYYSAKIGQAGDRNTQENDRLPCSELWEIGGEIEFSNSNDLVAKGDIENQGRFEEEEPTVVKGKDFHLLSTAMLDECTSPQNHAMTASWNSHLQGAFMSFLSLIPLQQGRQAFLPTAYRVLGKVHQIFLDKDYDSWSDAGNFILKGTLLCRAKALRESISSEPSPVILSSRVGTIIDLPGRCALAALQLGNVKDS